jgi:hypothetical protein
MLALALGLALELLAPALKLLAPALKLLVPALAAFELLVLALISCCCQGITTPA